MAAPIGSQILGEVLPYMELEKDNKEELEEITEVIVPNLVGLTVAEAKKILSELELELNLDFETEEDLSERIITKQTPSEGIKINNGNSVYCEIE